MKRDDYNRILRMMEHCAEEINEAETEADRKRLRSQYRAMSRSIENVTKGKERLVD